MPIVWRHLLKKYTLTLLLSLTSFIAVLLVMRATEIASFAASGAPLHVILLFTLYLIPYILPFALPISCLIAALLLFQNLSRENELTALRISGLSIKKIAFPILMTAACLSLINFAVAAEVAPHCKMLSKELVYKTASMNPFVFFQKKSLLKLKDAHIDMQSLKNGNSARDVVLILKNLSHEHLGVIIAKKLSLQEGIVCGEKLSLISTAKPTQQEKGFEHLIIENQERMTTPAAHISELLYEENWQHSDEYLPLKRMIARRLTEKKAFHLGHVEMEIAKRLSTAAAVFSFTLMGIAFGINIGRSSNKKGVLIPSFLALFFMMCFMGAKSLNHLPLLGSILFLLPHIPLILFSIHCLKRADAGIS